MPANATETFKAFGDAPVYGAPGSGLIACPGHGEAQAGDTKLGASVCVWRAGTGAGSRDPSTFRRTLPERAVMGMTPQPPPSRNV